MPITNKPYETDGGYGANRRVLRPFTGELRRSPRSANGNGNGNARQRPAPPESTSAENFYYIKQMNSRTPMVIVMNDGEQIHGCIEWYDRSCIKVNRDGAPNLLIQKRWIKYLFKREEA
jgi:host factor-I protein